MIPTGVAVLAAGKSRRMGTPKLLLPWGQRTVIEHVVDQWKVQGAAQIALVCAPDDKRLADELDRIGIAPSHRILNRTPDGDMFSSIQSAANWNGWKPSLAQWIVTLGDQPHLNAQTLRSLLDYGAAHAGKVCQPRQGGKRWHPVLLPKSIFEKLGGTPATNLKEFLNRYSADVVAFDSEDPGLGLDLDTPADYASLKEKFWPAG